MSIAALDVGGTNVKSGLVQRDDTVVRIARHPIDAGGSVDDIVGTLADTLSALVDDGVTSAAIAFPAPFDYDGGRPLLTHKFAALYDVDLASLLRARLGRPDLDIRFVNDAQAAAVGEAVAGAGRSAVSMLMITLGTGLGAAMTVDGRPVDRVAGLVVGDLYTHRVAASGDEHRTADEEFCAAGLARRLGVRTDQLAVEEGRSSHAGAVRAYGNDLGRFIDGIAARLGVDLVVLGGGAVPRSQPFADGVSSALTVPWRRAELGASGPLIGAAHLAGRRGGGQRPRQGSNLRRTV